VSVCMFVCGCIGVCVSSFLFVRVCECIGVWECVHSHQSVS
jgi:hypothetical protein